MGVVRHLCLYRGSEEGIRPSLWSRLTETPNSSLLPTRSQHGACRLQPDSLTEGTSAWLGDWRRAAFQS